MSDDDKSAMVTSASSVADEESAIARLADLADLGYIVPIASPTRLRAALAERQRLYAACLDESDYIYTVAFVENGKPRQNIYTRRKDAEKAAAAYGVEVRASPKKSGIVKLALALGIEARRKLSKGLPDDPSAKFAYCIYEATHKRTGRSEEGVGWCDMSERGGRISAHDVISTADTRAYNRAVLRLSGFGDVSADEIVGGSGSEESPSTVIEITQPKKPAALPASTADEVLTAQRWWAEEAAKRSDGLAPEAQQNTRVARELRAKARRGQETAARQLGTMGYAWQGPAQDSAAHETFEVEAPTVNVVDIERVKAAAAEASRVGWDLTGTGSVMEENRTDAKPVTRAQAAAEVPAPSQLGSRSRDGSSEPIANVHAKELSELLLKKCGTKDAAQAWLREHAGVERSALVRQNQFDNLKKLLLEG
jgi:hypothetical protein